MKPAAAHARVARGAQAFFYALMASPLLFHFQSAPLAGAAAACSGFGAAVAAVGLAYEAIADQQKSAFKIACRAQGTPAFESLYTGGLYARSRHANYVQPQRGSRTQDSPSASDHHMSDTPTHIIMSSCARESARGCSDDLPLLAPASRMYRLVLV